MHHPSGRSASLANPGSEQMGTKVELVEFSGTISETYRFELGIFEPCSPANWATSVLKHRLQSCLYPCSIEP